MFRENENVIETTISPNKEKFLERKLIDTIKKNSLEVSNIKELFEEVKFSVTNKHQFKQTDSFLSAVSCCMKLIAKKKWRTPKGFNKYCEAGLKLRDKITEKELSWIKQKEQENVVSLEIMNKLTNYKK